MIYSQCICTLCFKLGYCCQLLQENLWQLGASTLVCYVLCKFNYCHGNDLSRRAKGNKFITENICVELISQ